MKEAQIVLLLLLLQVVLDAAGDAFRTRKWQIPHHAFEALQIAVWIFIWAKFEFELYFIWMYVIGRFWAFDMVYNLITKEELWYVGKTSLYGRFFSWFIPKIKEPGMLVPWLKGMALLWWLVWLLCKQ